VGLNSMPCACYTSVVPLLLLTRAGLGLQSSYLYLPHSCEHRHLPSHLAYLLRCSLTNFFPGLALNFYLSDFCALSSWDYRCEPLSLGSDSIFKHRIWRSEKLVEFRYSCFYSKKYTGTCTTKVIMLI
jgi:hypothetical protein